MEKNLDKPKGAKRASTCSSDKQDKAEEKSSSETNRSLMPSPCAAAIVAGARVEARFDDDDTRYYPGVVTAVQSGTCGTCAIKFDDGDTDDCVPFTDLRLLKMDTKIQSQVFLNAHQLPLSLTSYHSRFPSCPLSYHSPLLQN